MAKAGKETKKETTGKRILKAALKAVGILAGALVLVVVVYLAYVILSYKRLPDNLELAVTITKEGEQNKEPVRIGQEYGIVTYNIGFGAYTPQFSFFMDGGKSSVAESKESVLETVGGAASYVSETINPDFVLWQEVDLDATRSYHVDEYEEIQAYYKDYCMTFAVNYDSAFLFYPLTEPHGKS